MAWTELEFAGFLVVELDTGQVGRQQVWCELDTFEIAADGFCKGTEQHGFAGARYIFQQNMTGADEAGQYERDGIVFADDDLRAVVDNAFAAFSEKFEIQNDLPFKIKMN